ncbi:unnamed protein product [Nezara viridula]|uniref:SANTA domain-containing protein n=1 Tax=Nezara viridula TaxID=85310 RepID=A0A9P0HJK0_NEZVI|nr:unnamed protein product [Nezara viridula]
MCFSEICGRGENLPTTDIESGSLFEVGEREQNIPSTAHESSGYLSHKNNESTFKADKFPTLNGTNRINLSRLPQVSSMKLTSNVSRVERDNDGFVIPTSTAIHRPKPHVPEYNEEIERVSVGKLSDLMDRLPAVEAFYYLKKYEEWLIYEKRKKAQDMLNVCPDIDRDKRLRILDWLHSNAGEPFIGNRGWNREVIEDYISVSSRNTIQHQKNSHNQFKEADSSQIAVFLLKNWTLIKGNGPMDLMVSGDLRDVKDQTLIEEGHVSSRILSADATIIKTSCCVYHLIGDFNDPNNSIPEDIKKHFSNSKFPNHWKEVVRKWNYIQQKQSMLCFSNGNSIRYGDKNETDYNFQTKKRKSSELEPEGRQMVPLVKKLRRDLPDVTRQTPMVRKLTNFSMITRSALRKRQNRNNYSFLGTPKSSKVHSKVKSRIKTPMVRRGMENQVLSDDTDMSDF